MRTISFDGVDICTESFGKAENPALLLIMGAMSSMVWWDVAFCEKLAGEGFFVIRYDNRDTGKSTCYEPGKPPYTFEDLADDAIEVLDAYGIEKAVVMGMSMGGMLTQMIALRHPERVDGIVLLSSMYFAQGAERLPYSSPEVNARMDEVLTGEAPRDIEGTIERVARQWSVTSQSKRPHDPDWIRRMSRMDVERANRFESRVNHSVAQVTGDELMCTAQISVPTLVIHGTEDVIIPYAHGEMLAKTIPGATLLTMDGAGHELHPLDYEDVAGAIAERFKP